MIEMRLDNFLHAYGCAAVQVCLTRPSLSSLSISATASHYASITSNPSTGSSIILRGFQVNQANSEETNLASVLEGGQATESVLATILIGGEMRNREESPMANEPRDVEGTGARDSRRVTLCQSRAISCICAGSFRLARSKRAEKNSQ